MPGPSWDREVEDAFERITSLDDAAVAELHNEHSRSFPENEFHEWFGEAFLQHAADADNSLDPHERKQLRDAWFDYMDSLGWDTGDFDWQEWREYMGYQ